MSRDWKVFQTDVLDLLRQYRGFFDSFERVGSLSDNSRPDAFARITRREKKEVWVLDAKNKSEIDSEDEQRMQKYIDQVARNPTDVGLEISEISEHRLRGIFITPDRAESEYEVVEFRRLHQFLQKNLIYTDTDKIVRDVAKMAERRELSQSQARILEKSLKPFRKRLEKVRSDLEELEDEFMGSKLYTPPFRELEFSPASDAVLRHEKREGVFLIDIPYSPQEAEKAEEKARKLEASLDGKAYYVSIHSFEVDSDFTCPPEEFKERLVEVLGILSPEKVAEMFQPKFETEKNYEDGFIELRNDDLGFLLTVKSEDDVSHRIEASLSPEAVSQMRERSMNSRKEFGEFEGDKWQQEIKIEEDLTVDYGQQESLKDYRQTVKNIFHSSVNPVYSKKIAKKVRK
jgi:hypothetical protein